MSEEEQVREQEKSGSSGDDASESSGQDESGSSEMSDVEREEQEAKEEVRNLEDDPPEKLEDWPKGKAMYETFGGPEGQDHGYHEGPEQNLGPDSLRHREDGDVEIAGEKVDDPSQYKGEPIPGGPTDPSSPEAAGEKASDEEADKASNKSSSDDEQDGS